MIDVPSHWLSNRAATPPVRDRRPMCCAFPGLKTANCKYSKSFRKKFSIRELVRSFNQLAFPSSGFRLFMMLLFKNMR